MAATHPRWTYDDFVEGETIELGRTRVGAAEIVEFASEYDPQPMHLDAAAGAESLLGGLGASGWHTCCLFMRLLCDGLLLQSTSQGAPGVDEIRWRRPVLPDDLLSARTRVLSKRPSRSRPTLGLVTIRSEVTNQRDEIVLELQNTVMFLTRAALSRDA